MRVPLQSIRFAALGLLLVACAAVAAEPTPENLKEAERVFRDVYGKDYDRVIKATAATSDKAAFGKKLWNASRDSRDNPGIARVLADKALPLVLADPTGLSVAIEIRRSQLTDGKDRPEQLAALALVLDRAARAEKAEKRTKLGVELVEVYREAAESCHDLGREPDAMAYLAKAKAAATLHLPAAQATILLKDIAGDQADHEAERKQSAELKRLNAILKDKPEDPKANLGMGLHYLREGKVALASQHLRACSLPDLRTAGELLSNTPKGDLVKVGDAFRAAVNDLPADKTVLLATARLQYEAALAKDPKHPDATRLKLLVKDLPTLKLAAPTGAVALIDEDKSFAELFGKTEGASAKIAWIDGGYAGSGCMQVSTKTPKQIDYRQGPVPGWKYVVSEVPGPTEYRYLRFAVRVVSGTYAYVHFAYAGYFIGKPATGDRTYTLSEKPQADWVVFTRDLVADGKGGCVIDAFKIETDGEVQIDAVYIGRSLRDLNRVYPVPAEKK